MECSTIDQTRTQYRHGNAWEVVARLQRRNAATGRSEAATGLSPTVYLSATGGGLPIAGSSRSLAERVNAPAEYYATYSPADMAAYLTGLTEWWEVITVPGLFASSARRYVA